MATDSSIPQTAASTTGHRDRYPYFVKDTAERDASTPLAAGQRHDVDGLPFRTSLGGRGRGGGGAGGGGGGGARGMAV